MAMTPLQYNTLRPGDMVGCLGYQHMLVLCVEIERATYAGYLYKRCLVLRDDGATIECAIMFDLLRDWHLSARL